MTHDPDTIEVEALAQHLHEEHDYSDNMAPGYVWPEHENDHGYRGNRGYVRIVPKDVLARRREDAARIFTFLGSPETGMSERQTSDPTDIPLPMAPSAPFVSPYQPPEGLRRELLEIIAEECAEVIQRVTKALRFGLDEVQPGQPWTNNHRIGLEVGDLYATIYRAQAIWLVPYGAVASGMEAKERQLSRFLQNQPNATEHPANG